MLLLHYIKQNLNIHFRSSYNTFQQFWFQICFLDVEVFVAMSWLSLRKTYKKYLRSSFNHSRLHHFLLIVIFENPHPTTPFKGITQRFQSSAKYFLIVNNFLSFVYLELSIQFRCLIVNFFTVIFQISISNHGLMLDFTLKVLIAETEPFADKNLSFISFTQA